MLSNQRLTIKICTYINGRTLNLEDVILDNLYKILIKED